MSVIKICKWCEKELEFNNDKQFGAHLTNCSSNPNKIQRDNDSIFELVFLPQTNIIKLFNC